MADSAPIQDLCPACACREADDEGTGFCQQCAGERAAEDYAEKDRERADERRRRWQGRTQPSDSPTALRIRQQRHRLEAGTRPKEFPDPLADPLELAAEALAHLRKLKGAVLGNANARHHLGEAEELVKQLAWGAEDDGDGRISVKEGSERKPRKRRVASRTFACAVCGDEASTYSQTAKYCSPACNQEAFRQRHRVSSP
jgi:hypothetical protein